MKRFVVFAYDRYYPYGGKNDMKDSFDKLEDAKQYIRNDKDDYMSYEYYDILDRIDGEWY